MTENARLSVGDAVVALESIYDDGEDHHPPGWLCRMGETLIVRKVCERGYCVSHEEITDSAFYVVDKEVARKP